MHSVIVVPLAHLTGSLRPGYVCTGGIFNYLDGLSLTGATDIWYRHSTPGITPATSSGSGAISEVLYSNDLVADTAIYTYVITYSGCRDTQLVRLTVEPVPNAYNITSTPALQLCNNTYYQQFAAATPPPSGIIYAWSAVNATIWSQSPDKQICVVNFYNTGNASVILSSAFSGLACSSTDTAKLVITPTTASDVKVNYDNYNFVSLLYLADSYQWGYDDVHTLVSTVLAGEINQNYYNRNPDFVHNYYWVKTTKNGCDQKSYYNAPTAVENINSNDATSIKLYPNPASSTLSVEISGTQVSDTWIGVCDMSGKMVKKWLYEGTDPTNISELPDGFYLLGVIKDDKISSIVKFVKIAATR